MTQPLKTIGCFYVGHKSAIVVHDTVEDGLMHYDWPARALDIDTFIQAPDLLLNHFSTVLSKNFTACFIQAMVMRMSQRFTRSSVTRFLRRFLVSWRVVAVNVMWAKKLSCHICSLPEKREAVQKKVHKVLPVGYFLPSFFVYWFETQVWPCCFSHPIYCSYHLPIKSHIL